MVSHLSARRAAYLAFAIGMTLVLQLASTNANAGPATGAVAIEGTAFVVDGVRPYHGTAAEGLLLNSRMINAIFDDENSATRGRWGYDDTGRWEAERNVTEFLGAVPSYAARGLKAVTVGLQGGNPVSGSGGSVDHIWHVSAFNADGSLKTAWMDRLDRVIRTCGANGIVVIVSLFYQGQDERLSDEAAVVRATDNVTDWLLSKGYPNVLVEIANESGHGDFDHDILGGSRVDELIRRVQSRSSGRLKVSASFLGGAIPPDDVIRDGDYVTVHGNGQSSSEIRSMVDTIRGKNAYKAEPKPILFNEDSTSMSNMDAAVGKGASWGYHDKDGFQIVPVDWTIDSSAKRAFFDKVASYGGVAAPPPPPPAATTHSLLLSLSSDRSNPVPLEGSSVDGGIYVFLSPPSGIESVRFYLDDRSMSGSPRATERSGPWDLAGGSSSTANPFDTSTLAAGTHTLTAAIELTGGGTQVTTATFTHGSAAPPTPTGEHTLMVSIAPNRSGAAPLEGQALAGKVYVFLSTTSDTVDAVRFYLDDPSTAGYPRQREGSAPWDFAGGSSSSANPFDVSALADGTHTITAAVDLGSTEEVVSATFSVGSVAVGPHRLLYSTSGDRSGARPLDGAVLSGNVYVFLDTDARDVDRVRFYLDDPSMSGSPRRTEDNAPWDFAGGSSFDTDSVSDGSHSITAAVEAPGGTTAVTAGFIVRN